MEWDEEDGHSIVKAKQLVCSSPSKLLPGDTVDVNVEGKQYAATVVASGM